ncbi:aromatic ring-hydroxylating oxygenase subunit alpha [Variovorax paradoxus]|nr:aromatic ring-hydroxylating dioxygenase subunit alpha [Variovorax paradoxus]
MQLSGIPVLTIQEAQALNAPPETALGLPGRAYFAKDFYEAERRNVFAAGWMGVGFASDLKESGATKAISIAGWELVLVRGQDGLVRCFHNICRHRGMKVIEGSCTVKNLRCPYHSWTYSLEGKLIATPAISGVRQNESPGIDKDGLGLVPVRCEQWFDVLFVNIDGDAIPLKEHLRPAINRIDRSFDLSEVQQGSGGRSGKFAYAANWKVILEGSIEDYHLPFVHRAFDHSTDYLTEDGGSVYAGFSSRRTVEEAIRRYETENKGLQLPMMPKMLKSGVTESLALFVFPNTVLSCGPYAISTSIIVPTGPESSEYISTTNFVKEGTGDDYAQLRQKNADYWVEVFGEDEPIWETVQALSHQREELGLATRFSPHWEKGLHLFQRYLADKLESRRVRDIEAIEPSDA